MAGTRRADDDRNRTALGQPSDDESPPESSDFATEHQNTDVAEHREGGPERKPEPESPNQRGGMDL
jgi:hypothetical protein